MISLRHEILWRGKPLAELNSYELRDALTWAALEIERLNKPTEKPVGPMPPQWVTGISAGRGP